MLAATEPFACSLVPAMENDDGFGLEEQVEQEERERCFLVLQKEDEASRHLSAFTDGVGIPEESCALMNGCSPSFLKQNPSSASSSQSPSPVHTPVNTPSSSGCKRKAECDSFSKEEPACKRIMPTSPNRKRQSEGDSCAKDQRPRKRLRGKQQVPALPIVEVQTAETPLAEVDCFWAGFLDARWDSMTPTSRYNKCYYKLRSWLYGNRFKFDRMLRKPGGVLPSSLVKSCTCWRQLPKWQKQIVVQYFLDETQACDQVRELFYKSWPPTTAGSSDSTSSPFKKLGKSVLLTYIGDWGLLPDISVIDKNSEDLRPWRELATELCNTAQITQLWCDFEARCSQVLTYLGDISWARCFEICMATYSNERQLRVHGHLFLRRPEGRIDLTGAEDILKFRGLLPKPSESMGKHTRSAMASWQGAFYCQCPKIGSLFSAGNVVPFRGYPVNGDWVFTLVQQEKIEYEDAKELIIRSGRIVGKRLQDLDAWRQARAALASQSYVQAAQIAHAAANLAWREIGVIETWKKENTKPMMRRKKTLVLVGKTGTGKTEYVKALFGSQHVLELNAAGMLHPCLRQFNPDVHRCILWDEAEVALIAQNRKLFQCPAAFVELGFSPTGAFAYSVMVNKAVMVVCSNRWDEQLQLLDEGDRDWILGNSVIVHVDEPLWVMEVKSREGDDARASSLQSPAPASSLQSPAPDGAVSEALRRSHGRFVSV